MNKISKQKMINKMSKTKEKSYAGHKGPKKINNYDRQQAKNFENRVKVQNIACEKQRFEVNDWVAELLRGDGLLSNILEEDSDYNPMISCISSF